MLAIWSPRHPFVVLTSAKSNASCCSTSSSEPVIQLPPISSCATMVARSGRRSVLPAASAPPPPGCDSARPCSECAASPSPGRIPLERGFALPATSKSIKKNKRRASSDEALLRFLARHLATDFPNPRRHGCPSNRVLERQALPARKFNPKVIRHLLRCSPCFVYYIRQLRASKKQSPLRRPR